MGLKENFNQALKEMLNKGGLVGSDLENKAKSQSDLDTFLNTPSPVPGDIPQPRTVAPSNNDSTSGDLGVRLTETDWSTSPPYQERTTPPYQERPASPYQERPTPPSGGYQTYTRPETPPREFDNYRQTDEMTVISKNTMIIGDIRTLANITIDGNVRGKVEVLRDATLRGLIVGDVTCSNSDMKGSSIQGNMLVKGSTYIDNDSLVLGDINSQYANIDGKVKGNLDIGSKIELRPNAIVAGNINTNSLTVMDGANIRGYINTTFLKEHGDSAFPKEVVIGGSDTSEQA